MLKKLPIDLSTLSELLKLNYLYVDKTKYAYDLITGGRRFFLSRPRRFGKTLFVSTLKEILLGNKELFKDLWISSSDYPWNPHGVITLDLSALGINSPETFKSGLKYSLTEQAEGYGITIDPNLAEPGLVLHFLVRALHARFGHVALLIDEYDAPILKLLNNKELAIAMCDEIRSFFAAVKGLDADLNFVFITGVSNFAKAGLFSGMNNLQTINLDDQFGGICGYTEEEVDTYLQGHIQKWAQNKKIEYNSLRTTIKNWYNGYRFSAQSPSVYNPFSLLNAIKKQSFKNFWFQSGAPTFLIRELEQEYRRKEYRLFEPKNIIVTENSLGIFDAGLTPLPALMFQTGYLTIVNYNATDDFYTLDYPNFEVKTALQQYMLGALAKLDFGATEDLASKLRIALNNADIQKTVSLLKQLFTNVPYQLHIAEEKFYHALLQIACDAAGIKAKSEAPISHGRIDLTLELANIIYIIEIKFNKPAEEAMAQIEKIKYYEPYLKAGKSIILLGLSFHRTPKTFDITFTEKRL